MQLQKLAYVAHGWWLGRRGMPLVREPVEAWNYGPVFASLYQDYKRLGHDPIVSNPDNVVEFDSDTTDFLSGIWNRYGPFTATQLSQITHQPGTPWSRTIAERGQNSVIPNEWIEEYYKDKLDTERKSHSANVSGGIVVPGFGYFKLRSIGTNQLTVCSAIDVPPSDATVVLETDGRERSMDVRLPNGMTGGNPLVEFEVLRQ